MSSKSPPWRRCGSAFVTCVVLGEDSPPPCLPLPQLSWCGCETCSSVHAMLLRWQAIKLHAPDIRSINKIMPCTPSNVEQYPCLKMPSAIRQCMCQCIASRACDGANLTESAETVGRCLNDVIGRRYRAIAQQLWLLTPRDRACRSTCQVAASRQHAAKLHDRVCDCRECNLIVCMHLILQAGSVSCRRTSLGSPKHNGGHGCTPS